MLEAGGMSRVECTVVYGPIPPMLYSFIYYLVEKTRRIEVANVTRRSWRTVDAARGNRRRECLGREKRRNMRQRRQHAAVAESKTGTGEETLRAHGVQ